MSQRTEFALVAGATVLLLLTLPWWVRLVLWFYGVL